MVTDYGFLVEGLKGDRMVKLENFGRSIVSYSVTLSNGAQAHRSFNAMVDGRPPHSIQVTFDELYQLSQSPGGMQLIFDNLYTDDMLARQAIGLPYNEEEVPEIKYRREDVTRIVQEGSEDELMDMVEFGIGAGLHYIAEWMKEELLSVDSASRKQLIGKMINVNAEALSDVSHWLAEDAEAGRLGYNDIKGLKTEGAAPTNSRRRRAGTTSTETPTQAPVAKVSQRRVAKTK